MKQKTHDHELIVQYLLGELSGQEKVLLEEQYFDDDDFFEQLLVAEDELTDAYVRGEMPEPLRKRFEARSLTSHAQRRRVEATRALIDYATESSVSPAAEKREPVTWAQSLSGKLGFKSPAIGLAFAAALLLIAAGGSLLLVETVRLRNQVEHIQTERAELIGREQEFQRQLADEGARNEQLTGELQRERSLRELLEQETARPQRSVLGSITIILTPDLVRDTGETKRLIIPKHADLVRMRLQLDRDEHKSYCAVIETVEGKRIRSSGSLKARQNKSGRFVTLEVPAGIFTKGGDYILTLSGVGAGGKLENVGDYYFAVVKK